MSVLLVVLALTQAQDFDAQVDDLARSIRESDLGARAREALLSKPGKTALRDQITAATTQARRAAANDALPAYFREHFDEKGRTREASKKHVAELLEALGTYEREMKELKELASAYHDRILDDPEVNAKVKRLFKDDTGLHVVYMTQMRPLLGRDDGSVEKAVLSALAELFVDDGTGKLVIREEMRERSPELLDQVQRQLDPFDDLHESLTAFAKRIKEDDGINGRLRKALALPTAAIALRERGAEDGSVVDKLRKAFDSKEGKLELLEDKVMEAETLLKQIDEWTRRIDGVRPTFNRVADRVVDEDWRALLKKDAVGLELIKKLPVAVGSTKTLRDAFETWTKTLFSESDGRVTIQEGLMEKVQNGLREFTRGLAKYRATSKEVTREAKAVADDEPVKTYYQSLFGQNVLAESLKAKVESMTFTDAQGLDLWIKRCFDKDGDGHVIRDVEALEQLVAKTQKIKAELEKSDITPGDK
jgi:hypothetical protein